MTDDELKQFLTSSPADSGRYFDELCDLDRRMRSLEEAKSKHDEDIADLQARVDRIESSTH
jgi:predicted  nucleic acid-binding Zn-ribbon protein